ncbi:Gfo/Idh/MocA family protein [Jiulongibacter sediminis]|jgi:hypothetical protein|uniref:Gfo/Idh/MocA family protein n=1 Tax=Jiulongibacter sediminis TaxID=1605367 RepID=UPI0026EE7241|nr:Gfo/Idh/MocA family oxidoreductase [Jiulongibacter sediminis]
MNRRSFISKTASAAALPYIPLKFSQRSDSKIRLGFIGTGFRGRSHVMQALFRDDVEIPAICDIDADAVKRTLKLFEDKGVKAPQVYTGNDYAYKELCKREDLDGIVISTPWRWHVPMAVDGMKAGKYTAVEVSATVTLQESWDLVNTAEETGSHCMILENVCYRRDVMTVLNMIRKGMFGEMLYAHCGYQHDLRDVKFNDGKNYNGGGIEFGEKALAEARWRTQHSIDRNGDIYPTHGLGPVAHWFDINRGNKFNYLTSMATKARGLHKHIVDQAGEDHPNAKVKFKLGDIVTTTIACENGENIVLIHDTNSPRPYSLGFRAQGTEGVWMRDNNSIYLQNVSEKAHRWESFDEYADKYDHPLWKKHAESAENSGHGGIDFFVLRGFIEAIKNKVAPPIDVYDAAVWSAISPLSELSIARGSSPVEIPDFTRGAWKTNKRIFGLNDDY